MPVGAPGRAGAAGRLGLVLVVGLSSHCDAGSNEGPPRARNEPGDTGAPATAPIVAPSAVASSPPPRAPSLRGLAYVATPDHVVDAMLDLAEVTKDDVVYDLGCGDGRILVAAARRGARGYGVDIDPARVAEARERAKAAGLSERITIEQRDMFTVDLSPATVVMLFVTAEYNEKLLPQLAALKPGARVVSHWFGIPNHPPDEAVTVPRRSDADWPRRGEPGHGEPHSVYLWRAPLGAAP